MRPYMKFFLISVALAVVWATMTPHVVDWLAESTLHPYKSSIPKS